VPINAIPSIDLTSLPTACHLKWLLRVMHVSIDEAGKLVNNEIPWRGDSALDDGKEAKLDLSKGMYDAGDHMKFGFTLAFTGTMLSWSVLEYGGAMGAAKQRDAAMDALGWMMDFLINAHPSDDVLYIQVILHSDHPQVILYYSNAIVWYFFYPSMRVRILFACHFPLVGLIQDSKLPMMQNLALSM
jgi:hypothetical protein